MHRHSKHYPQSIVDNQSFAYFCIFPLPSRIFLYVGPCRICIRLFYRIQEAKVVSKITYFFGNFQLHMMCSRTPPCKSTTINNNNNNNLTHYHKRLKCQGDFPTSGVIGLTSSSFCPPVFLKISIQINLCKAIWKDLKC